MDVLIVDDHPFIHETLRAVVKNAVPGAAVTAEKDLARALVGARLHLGTRSIFEYLLSLVQKAWHEAGRER